MLENKTNKVLNK